MTGERDRGAEGEIVSIFTRIPDNELIEAEIREVENRVNHSTMSPEDRNFILKSITRLRQLNERRRRREG